MGYAWLFYSFQSSLKATESTLEVCLFKQVTHVPCPSCGSTRAVLELSEGRFLEALLINPLGFIIALILVFTPLWIAFDLLTRKHSLIRFYKGLEMRLQNPMLGIPLIFLLLINWIWNITKGL